jgi:large subunit ribosomal protein L16
MKANISVIKKVHNKVRLVKKKFNFVDHYFVSKLFSNMESVPKKTRKWIYRRLSSHNLLDLKRDFFTLDETSLQEKSFDPLYHFFKRFIYPAVVSLEYGFISDYHLELVRRLLRKMTSKRSYIHLRSIPYKVILKRPNQVRMGGGKGSKYSKIVHPVVPGSVIAEVRGTSFGRFIRSYNILKKKLPVKVKFVSFDRL